MTTDRYRKGVRRWRTSTPLQAVLSGGGRGSRGLLWLFSLVVAAYCIWVLTLPVFPSQDGPLHLYYVDIFERFLAHAPGEYATYFRVGNYMPPYASYWYALAALHRVVSLPAADKIVVCGSMALTAFGFRYLATRIGPGGQVAAFLVLPVLLPWPLAMGFVNYMLSLGLALWAAGLWARFDDAGGRWRRWAYVALLYLMAITHPIPLALLLVGCGLDLLLRAVLGRRHGMDARTLVHRLGWRAGCLALALPAILYIRHFVRKDLLLQAHPLTLRRALPDHALLYLHGSGLLLFPADSVWTVVYRVGVAGVALTAFGFGALHAWRSLRGRGMDASSWWFLVALIVLLMMPALPDELNGAFFVAVRLVICVYLCLGLAMCGLRPGPTAAAFAVVCVLVSVVGLALGAVRVGGAARRIAMLANDDYMPPGNIGVIEQVKGKHLDGLTYRPYYWAPAHYFRRHGLILYNAAWLDEPQIPLKLNEKEGPLRYTEGSDNMPSSKDSPNLFKPGQEWNPPIASFFIFEEIKPPPKVGRPDMDWQPAALPVAGLQVDYCSDGDWFCIALRPTGGRTR